MKSSGASSARFASSRKVTGPSTTGLVVTPSALASRYSATGLSSDSENSVSGPSSGTR